MGSSDSTADQAASIQEAWINAWSKDSHVQYPASKVQKTSHNVLDGLIADAVDDAVRPWLRATINPNDDTLLTYEVRFVGQGSKAYVILPEFSAAAFVLGEERQCDAAAVLRQAIQDRCYLDAPIPTGTLTVSQGGSLQSLDERTCRIARLHQARLDLELSVTQFCVALEITEEYYDQMLQLDSDHTPFNSVGRYLGVARSMLRPNAPDTMSRPQSA